MDNPDRSSQNGNWWERNAPPGFITRDDNALLDLILVDSREELDALADENGWCRPEELTAKFYEYLDTRCLNNPIFDAVLERAFPLEKVSRCGYTFYDCRAGSFGPGNLYPYVQQALAVAENARRSLCTVLAPEYGIYWAKLAHIIPWKLTAAGTLADAEKLFYYAWNQYDKTNEPIRIIRHGTVQLTNMMGLKQLLQDAAFAVDRQCDAAHLPGLLQGGMSGRRLAFEERMHPLPPGGADAAELCDLSQGWRITNRLHHPPEGMLVHFFLAKGERLKNPTAFILRQEENGRWEWERCIPSYLNEYGALLKEILEEEYYSSAVRLWVLVIGAGTPLYDPQAAMHQDCYGIAIDRSAHTLDLTEGAEALEMLRRAVLLRTQKEISEEKGGAASCET